MLAADPPPRWDRPATLPPAQTAPPQLPPAAAPAPLPRYGPPDSLPPIAVPTPGRTVAFQKPTGSDTPAPATAPAVPQAPPVKPIPLGTAVEAPVAQPPAAQPPPLGREKLFRLESDLEVRNRIVRELVEEDAIRAKRETKKLRGRRTSSRR